jgi:protein gp37
MGDGSAIEWTDATWNPVVGCQAVSPGCDHCYAARQASTRLAGVPVYAGLAKDGVFTGEVRCLPERLDQPLKWRRPRRIFVNSMSDLFHPDVLKGGTIPVEAPGGYPFLAHVFARMVAAEQHTFQVLTKRPAIMAAVMRSARFKLDVNAILLTLGHPVMKGGMSEPDTPWPSHIWMGTSIESDKYAFRADHLRETPAAVRFLSLEPLLGPVDHVSLRGIDWVIVGGESGPGARSMSPAWARLVRDRCVNLDIPFLFKQWGEWAPSKVQAAVSDERGVSVDLGEVEILRRIGKKAAGRELDGRTWDQYPA